VISVEEAAEVRRQGWTRPVLIMGYVPDALLRDAVELEAEFTVYDEAVLERLDCLGRARSRPIRCHLKLETGTWRQGVLEENLPRFLEIFRNSPGVELAGVSTHFANIEDTTDRSYAREQLARFDRMARVARTSGFPGAQRHASCTAALLTMPETGFELARLGIGAYGLWPSRETLASTRARLDEAMTLRPVLSWKTRAVQVKNVPAGAYIGYGCTHRVTRPTRLVVIPVGYADGYDRSLSGQSHVLIRGVRAPVLGRICMNLFMADATDVGEFGPGEEIALIGEQGAERIGAADLAQLAQTIPYEIVTRLSPAIPRLAVLEGGRVADLSARRPDGGDLRWAGGPGGPPSSWGGLSGSLPPEGAPGPR